MRRTAAPKLPGAVTLAGMAVTLGMLFGHLELVALAAPLLVALAAGVLMTSNPGASVTVSTARTRLVEGEDFEVALRVTAKADCPDLEVAFAVPAGLKVTGGRPRRRLALRAGQERSITVALEAHRWGVHSIGRVGLRARGYGGWLLFEQVVDSRLSVLVHPAPERVRTTLAPRETQVFSGNHVAQAAGDGIEFFGVRPYTRGDSVKRVNWRVTSRRRDLHVNEFHPERNSEIVLFIDTFSDIGSPGDGSLDRAVRGAASLAALYLGHRDRVGLVGFGGTLSWLTGGMGGAHGYRIAEYLLTLKATLSYAWKDIGTLPPGTLPAYSFVVAFSPLIDDRAVGALADLHARRYSLLIIDTLWEDQIPVLTSPEDQVAQRVWRLKRAAVRHELASAGIPVVQWPRSGGLEAALWAARRHRMRPRARQA